MAQMCAAVESQNLDKLFRDLLARFEGYIKTSNSSMLLKTLEILKNFFEKVTIDIVARQRALISLSLSLVAYQGDQASEIYNALGRFLTVD
jgi:hypothetical protein